MLRQFAADLAPRASSEDFKRALDGGPPSDQPIIDDEQVSEVVLLREEKLARRLRKEANAINDAFTRYAFQALSICGAALGALIAFMFAPVGGGFPLELLSHPEHGQPLLGLAAAPILIFAIAVCRMGTYNFTDANRLFGYELHLARIRNVPQRYRGRWKDRYRDIDWEEAMRAWRVVQSTLFDKIYRRPTSLTRHAYRPAFDQIKHPRPVWFVQRTMFGRTPTAQWYGGRYLVWWQALLHAVGVIAVTILWLVPIRTIYRDQHLISYLVTGSVWNAHFFVYSVISLLTILAIVSGAFWFDRRDDRAPRRWKYVYRMVTVWLSIIIAFLLLMPKSWTAEQAGISALAHSVLTFLPMGGAVLFIEAAVAATLALVMLALWKRPVVLLASTFAALIVGTICFSKELRFPYYSLLNLKSWSDPGAGQVFLCISLMIALVSTLVLWMSARNERSRRWLLTDGLLSIHSCAITWQAVVVAHYSAIEKARHWNLSSGQLAELSERLTPEQRTQWLRGEVEFGDLLPLLNIPREVHEVDGAGYTGYNFWLSQEALSLARCADDAPGWTGLGEKKLREAGPRMTLKMR